MLSYEQINKLMEELKSKGNDISREAVVVLIDEGICTEERPINDYLMVKNLIEKLFNEKLK